MTNDQRLTTLRASAQQVLEDNILRFWQTRMVDSERGGFYGRIDGRNNLHPEADKGAVLNARILWAFAAAYRVLHKPEYMTLATRAKDYLLAHFIDPEYGGVYWSLRADGTPLDTKKQTYAIAFAVYGLAEYVRATGDPEALQTAIRLFEAIEAHAFTDTGYIEALTHDWQPIADMRLSDKDENGSRTMNTHLHVLEAYTNLYRIWPDQRVECQLRTLIGIFTDHIYNPANGHLDCFFDDNWNGRRDIISYGHDIEAAWLLNEALTVLSDDRLSAKVIPITTRIAMASVDGIRPDGSMVHEANDESRQWWVLCEQVTGFIDQWQITREPRYWDYAVNAFRYILNNLIDREEGEWYWAVRQDGTLDNDNDKAGFWKCPYHNSRMCLELIERL